MGTMCAGCRKAITSSRPTLDSHALVLDSEPVRTLSCASVLSLMNRGRGSKQSEDGLATVCHLLQSMSEGDSLPSIDTERESVPD